jgi:hypothetical protein
MSNTEQDIWADLKLLCVVSSPFVLGVVTLIVFINEGFKLHGGDPAALDGTHLVAMLVLGALTGLAHAMSDSVKQSHQD